MINGDVYVNGSKIYHLQSVTQYGTAYAAWAVCQNTANVFDEAVSDHKVISAHRK